jgi:hypothetical protein
VGGGQVRRLGSRGLGNVRMITRYHEILERSKKKHSRFVPKYALGMARSYWTEDRPKTTAADARP